MRGGGIIKEARLRAGLSQQVLAERLGTTQSVVTRWETGTRSPTFETVVKAVRACGLELAVAIGERDVDHELFMRESLRLTPAQRLERTTKQTSGMNRLLSSRRET